MKSLVERIKKFYKNESYEEERTMKIATTILIICLLCITPIVTHYKNVYWEKQYEKADEKRNEKRRAISPSPSASSAPQNDLTTYKKQ